MVGKMLSGRLERKESRARVSFNKGLKGTDRVSFSSSTTRGTDDVILEEGAVSGEGLHVRAAGVASMTAEEQVRAFREAHVFIVPGPLFVVWLGVTQAGLPHRVCCSFSSSLCCCYPGR
jgi:hypothetical protein